MSTWEVTLSLSGTVCVEVEADDEDTAREKDEYSWSTSDAELECEFVDEIVCTSRDRIEALEDDKRDIVREVAENTVRQFRALVASGTTRTLYAVPDELCNDHLTSGLARLLNRLYPELEVPQRKADVDTWKGAA